MKTTTYKYIVYYPKADKQNACGAKQGIVHSVSDDPRQLFGEILDDLTEGLEEVWLEISFKVGAFTYEIDRSVWDKSGGRFWLSVEASSDERFIL